MDCSTEKSDWQEGSPTLEAFFSVGREDLEGIRGLSVVIERLCDSLRELRRSEPGAFFGQPVERLYDSLEAALASFYCSRVSEEPVIDKNDPRGF